MNITSLPIFVADIIVRPTPPPIFKNVEGGGPASLPTLAFWAMAVVAALILWRMRRRRAMIEERATSISASAPATSEPTPAGPK